MWYIKYELFLFKRDSIDVKCFLTICTSLFADMFRPISRVMVAGGATNLFLGAV